MQVDWCCRSADTAGCGQHDWVAVSVDHARRIHKDLACPCNAIGSNTSYDFVRVDGTAYDHVAKGTAIIVGVREVHHCGTIFCQHIVFERQIRRVVGIVDGHVAVESTGANQAKRIGISVIDVNASGATCGGSGVR